MIPDGRGSKMLPIQVGVGFRKALQLQIASFQLALQTSFAKDSQCKVLMLNEHVVSRCMMTYHDITTYDDV